MTRRPKDSGSKDGDATIPKSPLAAETRTAPTDLRAPQHERRPQRAAGSRGILPAQLPIRRRARYQIVEEHARGGIGRILRAADTELGRTVALKELLHDDFVSQRRFMREALITARLEHPGIVPVYEAGRFESGAPFYEMKLVMGRSLKELIAATSSINERLGLLPSIFAVVDTIAYAHAQRIIHRDLKPSNIMVGEFGETVVVDWGLARQLDEGSEESDESSFGLGVAVDLTQAGAVVGTPSYMAPEQARGEVVDERTDVYALGAILYNVLSGRAPYVGASSGEVLERVVSGPPQPLDELEPGLSRDLLAIVNKAMARGTQDRYASANELRDDLRAFQTGQFVQARRYTRRERFFRLVARHRTVFAATVLALVVITVAATVSIARVVDARRLAEEQARKAETLLADSNFDRGRMALLEGDVHTALVLLSEALRGGKDEPVVRLLIGESLDPFELAVHSLVHGSAVYQARYSGDGRFIVAGTANGTAAVWDATSGEIVARWKADEAIYKATIDHSGRVVLTGGFDGVARVWSTSGELLRELRGHASTVTGVGILPPGDSAVTVSSDGARLWRLKDGALLHHFDPGIETQFAAVSPTSNRLATLHRDGTVFLWDLVGGQQIGGLAGHQGVARKGAFDARGRLLAVASYDRTVSVWNAASGERVSTLHGHAGRVYGVGFSPDSKRLLSYGFDSTVREWDVSTGALRRTFRHAGYVYWADYTPDGERILTTGWDGAARIWDADSGVLLGRAAGHAQPAVGGQISPDGATFLTWSWDGTVRTWGLELQRPPLVADTGVDAPVADLAISRSGEQVTAAVGSSVILLTHGPSGLHRDASAQISSSVRGVACSSSGSLIGIAARPAEIWDARLGSRNHTLEGAIGDLNAIDFAPDSRSVAAVDDNGRVFVWSARDGQILSTVETGALWPTSLEYDRAGQRLLVASFRDFDATVVALGTKTPPVSLRGHRLGVMRARFSPDGRQVITASRDGSARMWAAASGAVRWSFHAGSSLEDAAYDPTGVAVALASDDGKVWLLDAESGRLLHRYEGHEAATAVAFSPDGALLYSGGSRGEIRAWPIRYDRRAAADIAREVACLVPLRLIDGDLLPAPQRCAKHAGR